MRLVDRLEDFAFPSLSTSLYSAYNVSITAMLADMVDIFAKQFKTAYLNISPHHHITISTSHHITISTHHHLNTSTPQHHSVLMLSTGFCVATRHDCATTVAMTTAETPTKLSGKSHQWSGVCSAKLCSHCILSHQPTGAATANDTTSGTV